MILSIQLITTGYLIIDRRKVIRHLMNFVLA